MSMQKAQQKATGFFHKAKLWTKEKLGKRGPEDPVVEAASKKFLESKHELKELRKQCDDWVTANTACNAPLNGIMTQVTKIGLMGDEKSSCGSEVQNFLTFSTRRLKQNTAIQDAFLHLVIEPLEVVLKCVYECKDQMYAYENAKDALDSAAERNTSAQGKGPDKQTVAQHEYREAKDREGHAKAQYLAKCAEVEALKIDFLKRQLPQFAAREEDIRSIQDLSQLPSSTNLSPPGGSRFQGGTPRKGSAGEADIAPAAAAAAAAHARTVSAASSSGGGAIVTASNDAPGPGAGDDAVQSQPGTGTAVALYDYDAASDVELSFKAGDVINVKTITSDGWWTGELNGVQGQFPITYVDTANAKPL